MSAKTGAWIEIKTITMKMIDDILMMSAERIDADVFLMILPQFLQNVCLGVGMGEHRGQFSFLDLNICVLKTLSETIKRINVPRNTSIHPLSR